MTGPEHYVEAERLLALADRHTKGVTYEQKWTLTLTAAQVSCHPRGRRRDRGKHGRPGRPCLGRRRRHQAQRPQAGAFHREPSGP